MKDWDSREQNRSESDAKASSGTGKERINAQDHHPLNAEGEGSSLTLLDQSQSLYFDALYEDEEIAEEDLNKMTTQQGTAEEREPMNKKISGTIDKSYTSTSHSSIHAPTPSQQSTSRSWADENDVYFKTGTDRLKRGIGTKNDAQFSPTGQAPPFFARNPRMMRLASQASIGTGTEGRPGSIYDGGEGGEGNVHSWRATAVGSTPLDRTIDAIGMGRYQYAVLILSGFGWAADNMWLQGVAICLPRIQDEWEIRDQWIGLVSSSTFAGMMIGALAWGSYSDMFGRKNAFNMTLLITAIFGLLSSFAPNFPTLCLCLFLLGTGVGGSMPTDGTIFLEAVPKRNQYLLTALSVFFAAGSVVTSLFAFFIVPKNSCGGALPCPTNGNKGWRYLLASLGALTVIFVMARLVFFTLFESPKYLVSAGKHEEARSVLQRIAAFNGDPKRVRLSDVSDRNEPQTTSFRPNRTRSTFIPDHQPTQPPRSSIDWSNGQDQERQGLMANADEEIDTETQQRRHSFGGHEHQHDSEWQASIQSNNTKWSKTLKFLPESWRPSVGESVSRYTELFSPYWRKTTILVWSIWTIFTLAYTMVNVFLPKYLESRTGHKEEIVDVSDPISRQRAMQAVMKEFLLYSLASLPGSLLGAYLIETPLGRIKSMAISTFFLAFSLLAFAMARMTFFVILSSCSISLFASISYAVIYSYSPEVFKTSLRGTASGTASALSRLAGILAPVVAGLLLQINVNLPLYLGFGLFAVTVWLQISLPYETRGRESEEEI
ncbi:hypothetical protein L7F22_068280 [Adiantum nelumboides]|nr:hypothetical protein [Adiantum nelumboides]